MKYDFSSELDWLESHELLVSFVVPRPIALVSTVSENNVFNVAPFSFFGAMSCKPAVVYLGISIRKRKEEEKDTIRNIRYAKDFAINVVNEDLAESMNKCAADYPHDISEFDKAGLTPKKADLIKSPIVAESPINMECKLLQIIRFGEYPDSSDVVIGEILRAHIRDDLLVDRRIDMKGVNAIARLNLDLYCRTREIFELEKAKVIE
jgi:flavin reductase (DIM6/NTAB) family NADH-FMN oxidoreductase RutF